ncbi:MAG TPA: FAD-dependent oxidoreductase [Myxococcota bacterium]|nr:FAD-dependent oxidoreductase [Myxococcota bacterium]
MEIRLHGRGGQGGVTCAKILATAYARMGWAVQAFGDYAGERSGAPVRAYARVSSPEGGIARPITNRNKVYEPDHLLVLDPTLLSPAVVSGLRHGGTLLVNTTEAPESLAGRFAGFRVATIDATAIARKHGIGTRAVVIVNTTIAGAFARAVELPLETLEAAYGELGLSRDAMAAREAWEAVRLLDAEDASAEEPAVEGGSDSPWGTTLAGAVPPLTEHLEGPAPTLKTGTWRSCTPIFSERAAPCSTACPAGNDVVGFAQALAREGAQAAAEVLSRTTPFAAVCGRVCPGFCVAGCNRGEHDGPVDTRGLERWIAEQAPVARRGAGGTGDARRVAIVGGGPAGLAAAYHLVRAGHRVVIFEREPDLGGLLRTGIPSYRLPRDVLDREIEGILGLGVVARCGTTTGREDVQELADSYDAVILATGLQGLRRLEIEGADLPGVSQGIEFLHRCNSGELDRIAGHVVVLGGGNTAIDCARSALRAGAERVTVAYRRTRAEMPAISEEVDEAMEEGVQFLFQRSPLGCHGPDRVGGIELAEVDMGPPDEGGRRRPVVTDRRDWLDCDAVLLALGQWADTSLLPEGWELRDGRAWSGDDALRVFAAGDLSTRAGTVAHAIGDGRAVAAMVLEALDGDASSLRPDDRLSVPAAELRFEHFGVRPPAAPRHLPPAERARTFDEVSLGLAGADEARRCMSCGDCTRCDTCLVFCPDGCVLRGDGEVPYVFDYDTCKGCGICATECPRGCIEMVMT